MFNLLRNAVVIAFVLLCSNCSDSDSRSSAKIPFSKAFAPVNAFSDQTKISQSSRAVDEVLAGKEPEYTPDLPNYIEYKKPSLMASIFCLGSSGAAKSKYGEVVEQLSKKHLLGLKPHSELGLAVPATGYWTDENNSAKQVVFRYGNLVVIIQTPLETSEITVDEVKEFSAKYMRYLDTVAGVKSETEQGAAGRPA